MNAEWIYLKPIIIDGKLMFQDQHGRMLAGQVCASVERESFSSGTFFNIKLNPKGDRLKMITTNFDHQESSPVDESSGEG